MCAFWVLLGHCGLGLVLKANTDPVFHRIGQAYGLIVNGPAAVIVFFLISGFCIHYPYRDGAEVRLSSFYTRRFIRIGVPLLVAVPLSIILGAKYTLGDAGVLWSLICEMVYYALYPGLLLLARRFGWRILIGTAYLLAYGLVLTNPHASEYPVFGTQWNWLIGLPCWLLGCLLAQQSHRLTVPPTTGRIWAERILVVAVTVVCTFLRWHSSGFALGFCWTLNVFALCAYAWLADEIAYWRTTVPPPLLEKGGAWSYSLYIVHPLVIGVLGASTFLRQRPVIEDVLAIGIALAASYGFYRCVEKPSHLLAKQLGRRMEPQAELVAQV